MRLRRLRYGIVGLTLPELAVLLRLLERSARLPQIRADVVIDRRHGFFADHRRFLLEGLISRPIELLHRRTRPRL